MPDSFEDFAAGKEMEQPVVSTPIFFKAHPELVEEVVRIRSEGWHWEQIHRWLRDAHGFGPKSPTSIRTYLAKLGRI